MTKTAKVQIQLNRVTELPIGKLAPDPDQPRKSFDQDRLDALAGSIRQSGILVPILVRPGLRGKYIIVDGERRYRAAKLAKLKDVPVLLDTRVGSDEGLRSEQLAVNELREQLKPMDIARTLAGLQRDHFKSVNELAAYMESQGLPGMKPTEISRMVSLVDLPEWAQAMIDAGEMEVTAGEKLKPAMRYPDVLDSVKESVDRQIGWGRKATVNEVEHAVSQAFYRAGVNLNRTESYYQDPVHFNAKTVCKGCEHLVKVGGQMVCMSPEEYEKKNAEAKAAGLLPGGRKPEKQAEPGYVSGADDARKAEQRNKTLLQKATTYLHEYLVDQIVRHMQGDAERHQIDITDELLAWRSIGKPGARCTGDPNYLGRDRIEDAAYAAGVKCLEDFLDANVDTIDALKLAAAVEVARDLAWRETQAVCHELWGTSIDSVWSMDEAFLQLFRKAELVHLAETHGLEPPEGKAWDKLKLAEQRAEILTRKGMGTIGRPQILQDLYAGIDEPWVPYSRRDADLEDEDLCEHGVDLSLVDCMECEGAPGE